MWNEQEKKNSIVLFDKQARYSKFWKSSRDKFHWSNSWSSNRVKKKRRKHSPVVKGGGRGDRSEGTGILVDGAKHPFVLVKSSVQKSNEDESAPEKYSLTSKARRTKDTLFISLPFIASIPSRFTPSPLPNRFHDFPPLRDKVVPRFRHSRIIENAHVNTVKTKIIFASSSFSLKNRDRERERERRKMEKQWSVQCIKGLSSEKRSFVAGGWNWRKLRDIRSAYAARSWPVSKTVNIYPRNNEGTHHCFDGFRFFREVEWGGKGLVTFAARRKQGDTVSITKEWGKLVSTSFSRPLPPLHAIIKSYRDDRFFPLIDLLPPWEKKRSNSVQYLKFVNVRSRELSRYVQ